MNNIIYGTNVCKAALASGHRVKQVFIAENNHDFINYVRKRGISYDIVKKERLNQVSRNHQGVMIAIEEFKTYRLCDIIRKQDDAAFGKGLIFILDGLEDPHNFGAILRVADAAGVDGIVYRKTRSVRLNPTVVRVSAGAAFYVKCVETVNLTAAIKDLKDSGYWIAGAERTADSVDYRTIKYDTATALVIGSEGRGLSRLVRENCDYLVQIPMHGNINSLNAAVATGILTYHIKSNQ